MMNKILFFILSLLTLTASAEVFKCQSTAGVKYQSSPCGASAITQKLIAIKPPEPQEQAQAQKKLQIWREQNAAYELAKNQAEKAQKAEQEQQAWLETEKRIALAKEQQALATQRIAADLERDRVNRYSNIFVGQQLMEQNNQ